MEPLSILLISSAVLGTIGAIDTDMNAFDASYATSGYTIVSPGELQELPLELKMGQKGVLYPGRQVTVHGTPAAGGAGFKIQFRAGKDNNDDIIYSFSARFNQHGSINKIVQNDKVWGVWGPEEVDDYFPFVAGQSFIMNILCTEDKFTVFIDGVTAVDFAYREKLKRARYLFIDGDITLEHVAF